MHPICDKPFMRQTLCAKNIIRRQTLYAKTPICDKPFMQQTMSNIADIGILCVVAISSWLLEPGVWAESDHVPRDDAAHPEAATGRHACHRGPRGLLHEGGELGFLRKENY